MRKGNPESPAAFPSLFFRRVGEFNDRTNLGVCAKKNSEKYRVNESVHRFS